MRRHTLTFILLGVLLVEVSCTPAKNHTILSRTERNSDDSNGILGSFLDGLRWVVTRVLGRHRQTQSKPQIIQPVTIQPPPLLRGCLVQYLPNIKKIESFGCIAPCTTISPGVIVPSGATVVFTCVKGYVLNGLNYSVCSNGFWQSTPTCVPQPSSRDHEHGADVNDVSISEPGPYGIQPRINDV